MDVIPSTSLNNLRHNILVLEVVSNSIYAYTKFRRRDYIETKGNL